MSVFLLDLTLTELSYVHFCPSMLAASAIYVARGLLACAELWNPSFVHYTKYTEKDLDECVRMIRKSLSKLGKSKFQGARTKFAHHSYHGISKHHSVLTAINLWPEEENDVFECEGTLVSICRSVQGKEIHRLTNQKPAVYLEDMCVDPLPSCDSLIQRDTHQLGYVALRRRAGSARTSPGVRTSWMRGKPGLPYTIRYGTRSPTRGSERQSDLTFFLNDKDTLLTRVINCNKTNLGDSRTCIPANCLYALGVVYGLLLVGRLVHEAHITLLGLQNAWQLDLPVSVTIHDLCSPARGLLHKLYRALQCLPSLAYNAIGDLDTRHTPGVVGCRIADLFYHPGEMSKNLNKENSFSLSLVEAVEASKTCGEAVVVGDHDGRVEGLKIHHNDWVCVEPRFRL
ncbi:CCB22-like protein [Mya arenaria]|uniref:CCB22-like protein n=1 Tax=Mya arenaria TaxID=6604 RepID=A0ABY7EFB2_MYAAR|nr:CCB22-like protein [Mya arenaria]